MTPTFFMQTILSFQFRPILSVLLPTKKGQSNSLLVKIELPRRSATNMLFAPCGQSTSVSHKKFSILRFYYTIPVAVSQAIDCRGFSFFPPPLCGFFLFYRAKKALRDEGVSHRARQGGYWPSFRLFSLAKYSFVVLITTPDRAARAMRLGRAMRPLRVSAMSQTSPRSVVAPTTMTST